MTAPPVNIPIRARDDSAAAFASTRRNLAALDSQMQSFTRSFAAGFAGGAAFYALQRLPRMIGDTTSEMSRLAKDADKVGLLTDEFQRLQFGFELAGVEQAKFTTGFEQFNARLTEAQTGTGNLRKILDANNISLRNAEGEFRTVNQMLDIYANLIANAETSQQRMYLSREAFGRGGADFVLALRNGADGVRALREEADRAGGVLDEKLLRKAEELDDKWARFARTLEINVKGAILSVAGVLDDLGDSPNQLQSALNRRAALEAELAAADRAATALGGSGINTVLMGGASDRAATARLRQQLQAVNAEIASLQFNDVFMPSVANDNGNPTAIPEPIGRSANDNVRRQTELKSELIDLNRGLIETERDLYQQQNLAGDYFVNSLESAITSGEELDEVAKRLAVSFGFAAAQAALLGQGPLAQLFGGGLFGVVSGGHRGGFGGTGGGFGGFFADGGRLGAGKWGIAGERGPEIIHGPANVTPMNDVGGGTVVHIHNYSGQPVREERSRGPNGEELVEVMIGRVIDSGGADKAMKRFGLAPLPTAFG